MTLQVLSHYSPLEVIRLKPGDSVSEMKPKARWERWSSTPSGLSCSLALEVNPYGAWRRYVVREAKV